MSRRRPAEEEHENHERWLVSYADFITLLFAFFVVMYSLSSVNEGKYRVLSEALVSAFRNGGADAVSVQAVAAQSGPSAVPAIVPAAEPPRSDARREAELRRMTSMADEIRRVLRPLTEGGQVRVTEGVRGISVEINASVLFPPAEATLDPRATAALRAVAAVLATAEFPITVEGHTDSLPISTVRFPSNWELSAVRASSVVRLFIDAGVRGERLTAAGYGDQRPLASNADDEGRARNRRVTILIESMVGESAPRAPGRIAAGDPIRSILPPSVAEAAR